MSSSPLVTTREAAERLGVTTRQVARLVQLDRLTPTYSLPGIRGAHMFERDEIERYREQRSRRSA